MSDDRRKRYFPSETVLAQQVDDEIVLLDLHSESYFGLNNVGSRIWQLLQDGADREQIAEALSAEFEVEDQRLMRDVDALINQLLGAGLIKASDPGSS